MAKHIISEDAIREAAEYYLDNYFGYDGVEDYVEVDFYQYSKDEKAEIASRIKNYLK